MGKKKKQVKLIGLGFEFKEYAFAHTPTNSTSQFKTRSELFEKYKDDKDIASEEALKLYAEVRKISSKDVSLVTVRDHSQKTLNFSIETKNKVAEMKMSLENICIPGMIHLHKQTGDIIFTDMLKATLKLSRL